MTLIRTSKTKIAYGISSNSRSSIYRLPRITATPLAIFSFFYVLSVKLKSNLILQNWSVTIQGAGGAELGSIQNRKTALKITQNRKTAIDLDYNRKPNTKPS